MDWGTMRTLTRMYLNDPSAKVWSNSDLLSFYDDVATLLVKASEPNFKHYILPLTSGTRAYDLPVDCYEVRGVKLNLRKTFGTTGFRLEELDSTYLTATGTPEWYYLDDPQTVAFYPVPSWTDSTTTFTSEFGTVVQWNDGTLNYTFSGEFGLVIDAIDSSSSIQFIVDSLTGDMIQLNDNTLIALITYVYRLPRIVDETSTFDVPGWMEYGIMYGILSMAFQAEGLGKNTILEKFYFERFDALAKEWLSRSQDVARGQDQMLSQETVSWGNDLDYRMRVWP